MRRNADTCSSAQIQVPSKHRELVVFHPAVRKQQHPTDGVKPHCSSQWPRLDFFCRSRRRRNCCHLSSMQSRENKGDSHCHCLHRQLIITSTSKAVACAVISTAAMSQPDQQHKLLPQPGPWCTLPLLKGGNRQADNTATRNEIRGENQQKDKRALGSFDDPLVSFICCRHQPDSSRLTVKSKGKPRPAPSPALPFSLHDLKPTGRASFIRYITDPSWYSKDHV